MHVIIHAYNIWLKCLVPADAVNIKCRERLLATLCCINKEVFYCFVIKQKD